MSEPRGSDVRVEHPFEGVAVVTIDRADRMNTLAASTLDELDDVFHTLEAVGAVRAVVLSGAGGVTFAAGADLREVAALDPRTAIAFSARGQRVFDRIETCPAFVIAAVDGYCMGGGLDLASSCDARYASPRSIFAHPGASLGILTGFGGTVRLARLVGRARAIELFATARRIRAEEALAWGLVDMLADDPRAAAVEAARRVARQSNATTVGELKQASARARRGIGMP